MISDLSRRISSLRSPTALSSLSARNELLQTSSARRSVLWTAVGRVGRISCRATGTPREAACQAASQPAKPPPMIVIMASGGGFGQFFRARVIALVVVADQLTAVPLGDLLDQERGTAFGTRLGNGPVPEHEVAVGIVRAAEEHLAAPGFSLDNLAAGRLAVLRALHANRLVLDVLALRVAGAGGELAVAALLDDEIGAAARA